MKFSIALSCSSLTLAAFFASFSENNDLSVVTLILALVTVASFGYYIYLVLDKIKKYNLSPNDDVWSTLLPSVLMSAATCSLLAFAISTVLFLLLACSDGSNTLIFLLNFAPCPTAIVVLTPSFVSFGYCVYLALDQIKNLSSNQDFWCTFLQHFFLFAVSTALIPLCLIFWTFIMYNVLHIFHFGIPDFFFIIFEAFLALVVVRSLGYCVYLVFDQIRKFIATRRRQRASAKLYCNQIS